MKSSDEALTKALEILEIKNPEISVYTNVDGLPKTDIEDIRNSLSKQLVSPVRWELTIKNMIENGVTKFYEIGSGKVLTGLIKKIKADAETFNISTAEDLEKL
jgi:[acyl-carrier-protein] S-malonyltransferase